MALPRKARELSGVPSTVKKSPFQELVLVGGLGAGRTPRRRINTVRQESAGCRFRGDIHECGEAVGIDWPAQEIERPYSHDP
jgi:hypothetical protein